MAGRVAASTPARVPLTARWRAFAAYLPRLRAGGATARNAAEELRRKAPLDFGRTPDGWAQWIELGRWLDDPGRGDDPPHPRGAPPGPMNFVDWEFAKSYLHDSKANVPSPAVVASVVRATATSPDDGRVWLAFGRVLELEGRIEIAPAIYRLGLSRLGDVELRYAPRMIWAGLTRALMVLPGRSLERDWPAYLPRQAGPPDHWAALQDVLETTDRGRFERLLDACRKHPLHGPTAIRLLGESRASRVHDVRVAFREWSAGLREHPESSELAASVASYHLGRGRAGEAASTLAPIRTVGWTHLELAYSRGPSGVQPPELAQADSGLTAAMQGREALRLLEIGASDRAATLMDSARAKNPQAWGSAGQVAFALLGAGIERPWVAEHCRALLASGPFDIRIWQHAAGALATDAGAPWMERFLAELASRSPDAAEPPLVRSLWLGRRWRLEEALAALAVARRRAADIPGRAPLAVLEILSRPFWARLLGKRVASRVLEAAGRDGAGRLEAPSHRAYLSAVRAVAPIEVIVATLELAEIHGPEPLCVQALAVASALARDPAQKASLAERATVVGRLSMTGVWALHGLERRP
jgi:hypothetical protein